MSLTEGLSRGLSLPSVSRRGFLKTSTALAAAGGALATLSSSRRLFAQVPEGADIPKFDDETFCWASDAHNCGGWNCLHKVYVKNGRLTRVLTDDTGDKDDAYLYPQVRNCVRGKAAKFRVYDIIRVKYPLERTGPRGTGQFRRVSWDYATQRVAQELKRIGDQYGPHSVYVGVGLAIPSMGAHAGKALLGALSVVPALAGPVVIAFNDTSMGGWVVEMLGCEMASVGQGISDFRQVAEHSNLVILDGYNPATNIYLCNTNFRLAKMRRRLRERGVKVYGIDPRYNYTYTYLADEWIPINPQADVALFGAMMHTMLQEGLINWDYVKRFTNGWDQYQAYLLGQTDSDDPKVRRWADGIAKSPEWAEKITGVPAAKTRQLAIEFATRKPAALMLGLGPNRGAIGHAYYWAAITMAIVSGNIGKPGNFVGLGGSLPSMNLVNLFKSATGAASMAAGMISPSLGAFLSALPGLAVRVVPAVWLGEMLLHPEKPLPFGEKAPIIRGFVSVGNNVSMWPGSQKIAQGLAQPRIEFSCGVDYVMNGTTKMCDIVLPAVTSIEREDMQSLIVSGSPGVAYHAGLVKPMWDSKPDEEIWAMIAEKAGIGTVWRGSPSTEDVVRLSVDIARLGNPKLPSREEMRRNPEKAVVKYPYEPAVSLPGAYDAQVNDGAPFGTPSGKYEVYSETLERMHSTPIQRDMWWLPNDYPGMRDMAERIPSIPKWVDHWEGPLDPKRAQYPLMHVSPASIRRSHSSFAYNALLDDAWGPELLWINPKDAQARGIKNGDVIQVFNDRGTSQVRAFVTNRMKEGVVSLENGRWPSYSEPEGKGVDTAGCQSNLIRDCEFLGQMLPHAGQFLANICTQTSLVDVRKVADAPAFQGDPGRTGTEGGPVIMNYAYAIDGVPQNVEAVTSDPENPGFIEGITWSREKEAGKTVESNVRAYAGQTAKTKKQ